MKLYLRIKSIFILKNDYEDTVRFLKKNSISFTQTKENGIEIFFSENTRYSDNILEKLSKYLKKIDRITFHEKVDTTQFEKPFLQVNELMLIKKDTRASSLDSLNLYLAILGLETHLIELGRDRVLVIDFKNYTFKSFHHKEIFERILEKTLMSTYKIL